ncbi:MAG TPA: serine/threonine-protein kinase [Polyangiaceae bacterium]|nr:serine/threonine-protein kinase [Polyangiaceae bacterium]
MPAPPSPEAGALDPGSSAGKYRLVRRLGAGGMGEVWLAENRDTGGAVALKRIRAAHGSESPDAEAGDRFRREARLAAKLGHRGIVRVFDLVDEPDGTLLLVMELLRGETLERHLARRGPLPPREAIAVVAAVLAALAHAHGAGIVHRDVTPANVFLAVDPDGHVTPKLLDFGLAKVPATGERHTVDGRALGTPRYMAPERIREQDTVDGRSDLFSAGVVLYELLTGVCPFAASTPAASLAAVLETVVDPDPRIDPRLWIELRRALAKRPYERHAGADAMRAALLAASGETDATVHEALRGLAVEVDAGSAVGANTAQVTGALRGQSMNAGPAAAVPRRRLAWVFGVSAVLGIALGGVLLGTSRRPAARAGAASTSAVAAPVSVAGPGNTSAPSARAPADTFVASVAGGSATLDASAVPAPAAARAPAHAHPARPQAPKGIAVTPGF